MDRARRGGMSRGAQNVTTCELAIPADAAISLPYNTREKIKKKKTTHPKIERGVMRSEGFASPYCRRCRGSAWDSGA